MATHVLINILAPDQPGLLTAICGALFDLGINLEDTTFSILGEGCEFAAVCEIDEDMDFDVLSQALEALPQLKDATIQISNFPFGTAQRTIADINYRITITGLDQPGLVARFSEIFTQYDANIVRLNSQIMMGEEQGRYQIHIGANISPLRANGCLSALDNTAQQMGQTCIWEDASGGRIWGG